jgi:hypothetical protein
MDTFLIFILTHFVSDWLFQPATWGSQKLKNFKPRLYHAIQYAVIFLPVLYFLGLNLWWFFWIFLTHLYLDSYKFVNLWNKYVRKATPDNCPHWIFVIQDQIFHILVLIPIL